MFTAVSAKKSLTPTKNRAKSLSAGKVRPNFPAITSAAAWKGALTK